MLDLVLTNKEGLVENLKLKGSLGCNDHDLVDLKSLRAARRVHSKLTAPDFRKQTLACSGICSVAYHETRPGGKRGPRKLVDIQRSPPPISGAMHPKKQEAVCTSQAT